MRKKIVKIKIFSYCKMSKPDVSNATKAVKKPLIHFELKDILPKNTDATVKIKKVYEFLGADIKTFDIIGDIKSYTYSNITHYELTFIIKNKKTNIVEKLVIDLTKKNENNLKGLVSTSVGGMKSGVKDGLSAIGDLAEGQQICTNLPPNQQPSEIVINLCFT